MASKKTLADILYYDSERQYDVRKGDVMYLDAAPLQRKNKMSTGRRVFVLVVVAVAVFFGYQFINMTIISPMVEAANIQTATAENLKRPSSLETLPTMTEMINLDDDMIRWTFEDAGYQYYDMTEASGGTLTLFKLP